jgi:hypothetical protein
MVWGVDELWRWNVRRRVGLHPKSLGRVGDVAPHAADDEPVKGVDGRPVQVSGRPRGWKRARCRNRVRAWSSESMMSSSQARPGSRILGAQPKPVGVLDVLNPPSAQGLSDSEVEGATAATA